VPPLQPSLSMRQRRGGKAGTSTLRQVGLGSALCGVAIGHSGGHHLQKTVLAPPHTGPKLSTLNEQSQGNPHFTV
jgi:hypothetical protein